MSNTQTNQMFNVDARSAVLENADLLRSIGQYLVDSQLPFILSFKAAKHALKPLNVVSGQWIKTKKILFVSSVSMVDWAQSLGCDLRLTEPYENFFTFAASNGSVDVLRWLHQKYPPNEYPAGVNYYVCAEAALNGHLQVLEYMRFLGQIVHWNEFVCENAVRGGHLHLLHWLREVLEPPCPWDSGTCSNAASEGNLYLLKYLRAQDPPCPWSEITCFRAAEEGHLDLLKWLRSQEPPCPWFSDECVDVARDKNHFEVVEWILSQQ